MSRNTTAKTRDQRLEARISRDQKALFQRAAELQGRTLTDFVIDGVHDVPVHASEETQTIRRPDLGADPLDRGICNSRRKRAHGATAPRASR